MNQQASGRVGIAYLVMVFTPLVFSTNLIFGRGVVGDVAPFTLAWIRWTAVAAALSPFLVREWSTARHILRVDPWRILVLGFLGMWVCGGVVYLALASTTATNGTLIYTTSSVIIVLFEAAFLGRRPRGREIAGTVLALVGVATIILRGRPQAILSLDFNPGDLLFLLAATCWAGYSILYRSPRLGKLSNMALFSMVAAAGSLLLLPAMIVEHALGQHLSD